MRSKPEGRNYLVLLVDDKFPVKVNKKKADGTLSKLENAMTTISDILSDLYHSDYDLYRLVRDEIFSPACMSLDDGNCWNISFMASQCRDVEGRLLCSNDDIPNEEDIITLDDLGYHMPMHDTRFWEKTLEDTNEREVVDEVVWAKDGKVYHRQRTIEWEQVPGGRHSKSITYKSLRTGKKLACAIRNVDEQIKKGLQK